MSEVLKRKIEKMKAQEAKVAERKAKPVPIIQSDGLPNIHRGNRYDNQAFRGAYARGWAAGNQLEPFDCPYKKDKEVADSRATTFLKGFHTAWIAGYRDGFDSRLLRILKERFESVTVLALPMIIRMYEPGNKKSGTNKYLMTSGVIADMPTYDARRHPKLKTPVDNPETHKYFQNIYILPELNTYLSEASSE